MEKTMNFATFVQDKNTNPKQEEPKKEPKVIPTPPPPPPVETAFKSIDPKELKK